MNQQYRHCKHKHYIEARSCKTLLQWTSDKYYIVCVCVALVIQHAMSICHVVICGLPYSTIFFPHYLKHGTIFGKKKMLLNTKRVFWFSLQLLSQTFFILRRNERNMIKIFIGLHVKHPVFLSDFIETWIFWTIFRNILKYQVFMKILSLGTELFHADRRTDVYYEANSRFWQFCEWA